MSCQRILHLTLDYKHIQNYWRRERTFLSSVSLWTCAHHLGLSWARTRSQECNLALPSKWQESTHLSCHLFLPKMYIGRKLESAAGARNWTQALQDEIHMSQASLSPTGPKIVAFTKKVVFLLRFCIFVFYILIYGLSTIQLRCSYFCIIKVFCVKINGKLC